MSARARAALLRGRRRAEALMQDQCTISRVVGETMDEIGRVVPVTETVYEGPCKVQSYEGYEESREVIAHSAVVQRMSIHIPVGAYRCSVGDVLTLEKSFMDPLLEGRKFRITQEAPFKTFATAYRIFVDFKAE